MKQLVCPFVPSPTSSLSTAEQWCALRSSLPSSAARTLARALLANTEVTQAPGQALSRKRRGKRGGRNQAKRPKEQPTTLSAPGQAPLPFTAVAAVQQPPPPPYNAPLEHTQIPPVPLQGLGTSSLDLRAVPQEEHQAAQEYNGMLDLLTFNSKEIINNLTKIAGENLNNANGIVYVLEQRIFNSAPEAKLPYLYLVDSILKNIGDIYVHRFSRNLFNVFRNVYSSAQQHVRGSLHRLLNTWPQVFAAEFVTALRRCAVELDSVAAPSPMYNTQQQLSRARIPRVPLSRPVNMQPSYQNVNHPTRARSIAEVPIPRQASHQQQPHRAMYPPAQPVMSMGLSRPIAGGVQGGGLHGPFQAGVAATTYNAHATPNPLMQPQGAIMARTANGAALPLGMNESLDHAERLMAEITRKRSFGIVPTNDELALNTFITDQLRGALPVPMRQRFIDLQSRLAPSTPQNVAPTPQPPYPTAEPRVVVPALNASALNNLVRSLPHLHAVAAAAQNNNHPPPPTYGKPMEFADIRKTSHRSKVRALYADLPFHSKSDGMRFATEQEHFDHLDWLFKRNRRMRARQQKSGGLSRCWYDPMDVFLGEKKEGVDVQNAPTETKEPEKPVEQCVEARVEEERCPACCEGFTTFWHEEKQVWMLRDAVRNKHGVAFHSRCAASIGDIDAYDDEQSNPALSYDAVKSEQVENPALSFDSGKAELVETPAHSLDAVATVKHEQHQLLPTTADYSVLLRSDTNDHPESANDAAAVNVAPAT